MARNCVLEYTITLDKILESLPETTQATGVWSGNVGKRQSLTSSCLRVYLCYGLCSSESRSITILLGGTNTRRRDPFDLQQVRISSGTLCPPDLTFSHPEKTRHFTDSACELSSFLNLINISRRKAWRGAKDDCQT